MPAGLLQVSMATMRAFGLVRTICVKCSAVETFKQINEDGSHSYLCKCGCTIYRFHKPDQFHNDSYFLKIFIPIKRYRKDWKNKDFIEKSGYKKEEKDQKVIYRLDK